MRQSRRAAVPPVPGPRSLAPRPRPPRFADPQRVPRLAAAFGHVDAVFRDHARAAHVPGAAWGIVVDRHLAHTGTAGVREIGSGAPVEADSVFRVASLTKSVTAMAILRLRDDGRLALDDPAERWVPELRALRSPTGDAPRVTIRHLLSHAAGLPEDDAWADRQLALGDAPFSALLRRGLPFAHAPGVAYEYSNLGFMILGRVVARAAGMPYAEYVTARLLRPLGLRSATFDPAAVPVARLATGYRWESGRWTAQPQPPLGAGAAMGGLLVSLRDLGAYVALMLDAWPSRDDPESGPVRRASLREMQQVRQAARPRPSAGEHAPAGATMVTFGGYGFGLEVGSTTGVGTAGVAHVVGHAGGLPGFGSLMRWLPDHGVGLAVVGNGTYTDWGPAADRAVALLAATGALRPRVPRPSPALAAKRGAVSRLVLRWDDRLADGIAAPNLFLDRSRERRRAEIGELLARVGPCGAGEGFATFDEFEVVESALRGAWLLPCARGALRVAIALAPTVPVTVQSLDVSAVLPDGHGVRHDAIGQ